MHWRWDEKSGEMIMMSSIYRSRLFHGIPCNNCSISLWKVAVDDVRPNDNTFHFYRPERVAKSDFCWSYLSKAPADTHLSGLER